MDDTPLQPKSEPTPYERFQALGRRVLAVPKREIAETEQRLKKAHAKPKPAK